MPTLGPTFAHAIVYAGQSELVPDEVCQDPVCRNRQEIDKAFHLCGARGKLHFGAEFLVLFASIAQGFFTAMDAS